MAYDMRRPAPKPGYYCHYQHGASGPCNNYAYYIYGLGHQPKMIAVRNMRSCRSAGLYTKPHMRPEWQAARSVISQQS